MGRLKIGVIEQWRLVGQPGNPPFGLGWENYSDTVGQPLAFFRDPEGFVHIRGRIKTNAAVGATDTIFYLPFASRRKRGYRPEFKERILVGSKVVGTGVRHAMCEINPFTGAVNIPYADYEFVTFDDVSLWAVI